MLGANPVENTVEPLLPSLVILYSSQNELFQFSVTSLLLLICMILIYLFNLVFNVVNKKSNLKIIECLDLIYVF